MGQLLLLVVSGFRLSSKHNKKEQEANSHRVQAPKALTNQLRTNSKQSRVLYESSNLHACKLVVVLQLCTNLWYKAQQAKLLLRSLRLSLLICGSSAR